MPHALASALVLLALVLPLVLAIFALLAATTGRRPASEILLASAVLTPLAPLLELTLISLLPIADPLNALLPWAHLAVVAVAIGLATAGSRSRRALRRLGGRIARSWTALDAPTRAVCVLGLAVVLFASVHAAWNAGDENDGAMYRLYVAMQPVQDGRVGAVPHPWPHYADSYPRTIELMYSWTILCVDSAAGVHLVNWYFLCVFGLATFVLGRRLRLRLRPALLCALLAATTPMPLYLSSILYNDLGPAALFVSGLAFLLPPPRRAWTAFDVVCSGAALGLAASAKIIYAVGAAVVCGIRLISLVPPRRVGPPSRRRASAPLALGVLLLCGALASVPYVRSWIVYGSPVWPLKATIAGVELFDGPYAQEMLMITAKGSFLERWWTAVFKLFQTTSQDANGAFGLLFAIAIVPVLVWSLIRYFRRPRVENAIVLAALCYAFVLPASSNLRYSMHLIPLCYVVAAQMTAKARRDSGRHSIAVVAAVFLAINSFDYLRAVIAKVAEQLRWGVSLTDPHRNRDWYYQFAWWEHSTHPETHTAVHDAMRPGERLVYATRTFPGMLYDPSLSYAVEYRSVDLIERWPLAPATGRSAAETWLESLHADDIDAVLVHAGSPEDTLLARGDSGYALVYDQPDRQPPRQARLYRRTRDQLPAQR